MYVTLLEITFTHIQGRLLKEQLFSSIAPLVKWDFFKRKEFASRGIEFFPFGAVTHGIVKKSVSILCYTPCTLLITHMRKMFAYRE